MRRSFSSAAFLFIAAALAAGTTYAAGNVLLPPTSSDNTSSLPNLGLGISTPAQNNAAPAAPAERASPASQPAPPVAAAPAVSTPLPVPPKMSMPTGQISMAVVQQNDWSQFIAERDKNLPYGLMIAIDNKSVFGTKDVQEITSKLGLTRDQIASSCYLAVEGLIQTNKNGYPITNGSRPPPVMVHYDGIINEMLLSAAALCTADSNRLPRGAILLNRVNDRFDIPLQALNCTPPHGQPTSLTIGYNGSGKTQCVYN